MKVLLIGDVIGQPGRKAVKAILPGLREEHEIDVVIANVENLAGGFGVTRETLQDLKKSGVDVFSSGNHIWDKKEVSQMWNDFPTLLRPANYPLANEGRGWCVFDTPKGDRIAVLNLLGRVFMPPVDDPFAVADRELKAIQAAGIKTVLVDFHAEATSESIAFTHYLDGRVACVAGTHTHVATADGRVSAKGTAAITDLGMTGSSNGVIGMESEGVLKKFLTGRNIRYQVAQGDLVLWALLLDINQSTGKTRTQYQLQLAL